MLFITMINDLQLASNTFYWKYVHDVPLSEIVNVNTLRLCHRTSAQLKAGRTRNNNMKLNGNKCKEMIIIFHCDEIDIPRLCIENVPLELVTSFKVLVVTLNNKLKWQDNTVAMIKKASKRLHTIRVL